MTHGQSIGGTRRDGHVWDVVGEARVCELWWPAQVEEGDVLQAAGGRASRWGRCWCAGSGGRRSLKLLPVLLHMCTCVCVTQNNNRLRA